MRKAGHDVLLACENDPAARLVLGRNLPGIDVAPDVTSLAGLPPCDVVTAGWPCQDISLAGRRSGIRGKNSGLVDHVFRLIERASVRPRYVLLENVAFALDLAGGEAVRHVTTNLARLGYRWAYRVLDTRMFGLPQRRRRLFVLACRDDDAASVLLEGVGHPALDLPADPAFVGFYWTEGTRGLGWAPEAIPPLKGGSNIGIPSPPAIWDRTAGTFHTPELRDAERLQGFPEGWTEAAISLRNGDRQRWRLVGNAVSVPVVEWLGHRLATTRASSIEGRPFPSGAKLPRAAWGGPGERSMAVDVRREGSSASTLGSLSEFGLSIGKPLSRRALSGFVARYEAAPLRKNAHFVHDLRLRSVA